MDDQSGDQFTDDMMYIYTRMNVLVALLCEPPICRVMTQHASVYVYMNAIVVFE